MKTLLETQLENLIISAEIEGRKRQKEAERDRIMQEFRARKEAEKQAQMANQALLAEILG